MAAAAPPPAGSEPLRERPPRSLRWRSPRSLPHWLTRPSPWIAAAAALALVDCLAPRGAMLFLWHLVALPIVLRLLRRRGAAAVAMASATAVALPGALRPLLADPWPPAAGPLLEPARLWTLMGLATVWMYHQGQQRWRARRAHLRRQLRAHMRRRTAELRRANLRLMAEAARRQTAQQLLVESEGYLQSLIDHLQLHVIRKNAAGVFTYASPSFCRLLGRRPEEVLGRRDEDFYPPATASKYREDDRRVMEQEEVIDTIEVNPQADGKTSYVQVLKAPSYDARGQVAGIQAVFWDVTDRLWNEIELRRSETRIRALFATAADGILLVDAQGRVVEANRSAAEILRIPIDHLVGRPLAAIARTDTPRLESEDAPPHSEPGAEDAWGDLPQGRLRDLNLTRGDGDVFPAELSTHPIPLEETTGLAIFLRDITERQRGEQELRDAKDTAEQASRAKSQFLAGVSHEIRTPLGGILGLAQLLSGTPLSPRQRQYVDLINQSADLLRGIIEDLLDFSRMEAGRLVLEREPLDLHRCIGEAFKCLAANAITKELELIYRVAPDVPQDVLGDALRLRQIVVNLAGNALKFTSQGEVVVELRCAAPRRLPAPESVSQEAEPPQEKVSAATSGEMTTIELVVRDTGIGIARNRQRDIFDAFQQADSGTTRRFGGTGLGLAITQRIVEAMGGEVMVESELERGSTFTCRLPLPSAPVGAGPRPAAEPAESNEPPEAQEPAEAPGTALLVIRHPGQRRALSETLSQAGWEVRPYATPADVLEGVDSQPALFPSSAALLVLDADTPQAASLLQQAAPRRAVWIAQLGSPPPNAARRNDPLLIKPVLPSELLAAAHPTTGAAAGARAAEPPSPSQRRVLVVDDSPVNRIVIRDMLAAAGHTVRTASGGDEAVKMAGADRFDVILMDLQMPEVDGITATGRIRVAIQRRGGTPPPVFALTAHVTEEHRRRCLEEGMAGFITKPVHRESLLRQVAGVAAVATREPVAKEQEPEWVERFMQRTGQARSDLPAMIDAFLQEVPQLVKRLGRAIDAGDATALRHAAHTLKSCLRYVSQGAEVETAAQLEQVTDLEQREPWAAKVTQVRIAAERWCDQLRSYRQRQPSEDAP